ncbi:hypothetical protein OAG71_02770, partial [bacterium]|nr:hypothetical protein [bacterium]
MKLFNILTFAVMLLLLIALAAQTHAQSARRSPQRSGNSFSRSDAQVQSEESEQPKELPPLSEEAQAAMKTFELTRTTLGNNKRLIDKLYRTVPIGFVEKQTAHMQKIKQLEAQNEILSQRITADATNLFRLAPNRNRFATALVMRKMVESL